MSTLSHARPDTDRVVLHPLLAAGLGAAVFAATMTAGGVLDLNPDDADAPALTVAGVALYALVVGVAVALAGWLGTRALARGPRAVQGTSAGMAVAAAVTLVAFWSGWPLVLGAVAAALALEHRRQVGSFSATTGISTLVGVLALTAAAVLCVVV